MAPATQVQPSAAPVPQAHPSCAPNRQMRARRHTRRRGRRSLGLSHHPLPVRLDRVNRPSIASSRRAIPSKESLLRFSSDTKASTAFASFQSSPKPGTATVLTRPTASSPKSSPDQSPATAPQTRPPAAQTAPPELRPDPTSRPPRRCRAPVRLRCPFLPVPFLDTEAAFKAMSPSRRRPTQSSSQHQYNAPPAPDNAPPRPVENAVNSQRTTCACQRRWKSSPSSAPEPPPRKPAPTWPNPKRPRLRAARTTRKP